MQFPECLTIPFKIKLVSTNISTLCVIAPDLIFETLSRLET